MICGNHQVSVLSRDDGKDAVKLRVGVAGTVKYWSARRGHRCGLSMAGYTGENEQEQNKKGGVAHGGFELMMKIANNSVIIQNITLRRFRMVIS